MVTHPPTRAGERAALMTELVVAMGILVIAAIPLAFGFAQEHKLCRTYYQRAVLIEILDGEMEVLAAGAGRALADGTQPFQPHAAAATNLPPGNFALTKEGRRLRLEWRAAAGTKTVSREVVLP